MKKCWSLAMALAMALLIAHEMPLTMSFAAEGVSPDAPVLPKEAQGLLSKVAALESYKARFTLEVKEASGEPVRLTGTLLFQRPNRRRLEIWEGQERQEAKTSQLLISDGKMEWQYSPEKKTVYRVKSPADPPGPHRPFAEVRAETLRFVKRLEGKPASLARFEGDPIPSVVEGSPIPIQRLRVDVGEADGLVREMSLLDTQGNAVLSQRYQEVEVNVPIPEGTFTFTPPEGTEVVDLPEPATENTERTTENTEEKRR